MKKCSSAGGTSHSRLPGTNSITRYPILGVPERAVLGYPHGREASSQRIPGKFLICCVRGRLRRQTEQQLCGNHDRYSVSTYYESYIPPLSSLTLLAFLTTSVLLPSHKEQPLWPCPNTGCRSTISRIVPTVGLVGTWRNQGALTDLSSVNGASLANSKTTPQFRRSARLKEIEIMRLKDKEKTLIKQLRSPTASDTQQLTAEGKRKSSHSYNSANDVKHHLDNKKPNASHQPSESIELNTRNPVAYWALTQNWPVGFSQQGGDMGPVSSNKRKSESVHTHRVVRLARMQEHRIFMGASALMKEASKDLCAKLLKRNRGPVSSPFFPAARLLDVLQRVESANEGRIQRDVLPCVVPSAENLHFCGVLGLESIVEEISALWTRCATMGSTIPKPDYVAGLSPGAFSSDELSPPELCHTHHAFLVYAQPLLPVPHLRSQGWRPGLEQSSQAELTQRRHRSQGHHRAPLGCLWQERSSCERAVWAGARLYRSSQSRDCAHLRSLCRTCCQHAWYTRIPSVPDCCLQPDCVWG